MFAVLDLATERRFSLSTQVERVVVGMEREEAQIWNWLISNLDVCEWKGGSEWKFWGFYDCVSERIQPE